MCDRIVRARAICAWCRGSRGLCAHAPWWRATRLARDVPVIMRRPLLEDGERVEVDLLREGVHDLGPGGIRVVDLGLRAARGFGKSVGAIAGLAAQTGSSASAHNFVSQGSELQMVDRM